MAGVIASKVRKQRVASSAVKVDREEDQVGTNYLNVGNNQQLTTSSNKFCILKAEYVSNFELE